MGFSTILSNILIGAGPFSGLTGSEAIVSFLLLIDSKIYGLFAEMYTLYIQLARAQIFDISAFDFRGCDRWITACSNEYSEYVKYTA